MFGLALAVLLLDLMLPLGVIGAIPYILLVLAGRWFKRRRHIFWLAFLTTVLTVLGFIYSTHEGIEWVIYANKALTIIAIWITAIIVSASKADENLLIKQAEQLHTLSLSVEHSPIAIMITKPDGTTEYVNRKFVTDSGYSPSEVIGENPRILQSGETPSSTHANLWQTILAGEQWTGEYQNRKKSGEPYWVKTSILPIMSDAGDIQHFVSLQEDVTERKALQEQLTYQALHDELTKLANRKAAIMQIEHAIASAKRNKCKVALLFIDLDGFKAINDNLGHDAGDFVLKECAERMLSSVREVDLVSRIGGDEFLIAIQDLKNVEDINLVAQKLINKINQKIAYKNDLLTLGCSIGIALYPDHDSTPKALITKADKAMYQIKSKGKNSYALFDDSVG